MSAPVIRVQNLQKSFGDFAVLRGIDFALNEKDSFAIIGGSGTGKSVTLRCLLGLMQPDDGRIEILGQEQTGSRRPHDKIGMLFQGGALFDSLPVWKNVSFYPLQNGASVEEARAIAKESLKMVGMKEDMLDASPAALSGGMHKRVGLARAIAPRPPILFFDEPTTGLDPIMSDLINHLIKDCVQELGATAITITHDMSSVKVFATQLGFLYDGKLQWSGAVPDMAKSKNPYLEQFVAGRLDGPIQ